MSSERRSDSGAARPALGRPLRCPVCGERRAPSALLTLEDVAARLGTSLRHARRLADERRIPIVKVGRYVRFDAHELEHWIDDHRIGVVDQAAVARAARRRRMVLGGSVSADGHRPARARTA